MIEEKKKLTGGFTMPGESGYEKLTLELAEKWGADVIRDSDGTQLSDEILQAGYDIYSTICIIRDHNEWAGENQDKLQQTFLVTEPKVCRGETLVFGLMDDFFTEQFRVNDAPEAIKYWQVYDRTAGQEVARKKWSYDGAAGTVTLAGVPHWHQYTVSFLAYRIWEEISMYNHTTNNWDKEHLMQIDPIHPQTQEYLQRWLTDWCENHPQTDVVRFTSMFYNFVWIWGSDERRRNLFTDWGSYDFTVSPRALEQFEAGYGYALTAEDFVNQGKYQVTHMPATDKKRDWMDFINRFVVEYGSRLVDIVHEYGKKAYVFYDDSWVGVEPYHARFQDFHFDGLIKCVFSGYEARLCADVDVPVHEIRLHPYLFPVGLGGAPTFMEGGNPTLDAKKYWNSVRRALLRKPVDRIGLGGYLHLVEDYPEFCNYIEQVADEFRMIRMLHQNGGPYTMAPKAAVLHYWGDLRSWTLSGHFHESYMHDLIHVIESLAGLPLEVSFVSLEEAQDADLSAYDVLINAGKMGDAWSGGDVWKNPELTANIMKWVDQGGTFIGIGEPSAAAGTMNCFQMAPVLGVDMDLGARISHGRWEYHTEVKQEGLLYPENIEGRQEVFLTGPGTRVFAADEAGISWSENSFGMGRGVYLSGYQFSLHNTRFLLDLILSSAGAKGQKYLTDNLSVECAYYPADQLLFVINNSEMEQEARIDTDFGVQEVSLEPFETVMIELR